jgi:chromosomal replication initiator protein
MMRATKPAPRSSATPSPAFTAALGELQLEMTRATYDTWVKPTVLLSVNGTWKIDVPTVYAQEWLNNRLMSTVKRVLTGVIGEVVQPEFVVVQRWPSA